MAKVLRMKKFNLLNDEKQNVKRPLIEINEKSIWENCENIQHEKKIKFILEDTREEKQNELSMARESKEIKLKFIAIVFDRLFFYTASVYTIITFFGLLMFIWYYVDVFEYSSYFTVLAAFLMALHFRSIALHKHYITFR